jgi:hypothetical protein
MVALAITVLRRFNFQTAKASPALFFVRRGRAGYSLGPSNMRGAERRKAQPIFSALARRGGVPCDRDTAPSGAPLAAFNSPGPRFRYGAFSHRASASSWQGSRSAGRAEPRNRPSADLRSLPAGAAPGSTIKTPLDGALDELGERSVQGECGRNRIYSR